MRQYLLKNIKSITTTHQKGVGVGSLVAVVSLVLMISAIFYKTNHGSNDGSGTQSKIQAAELLYQAKKIKETIQLVVDERASPAYRGLNPTAIIECLKIHSIDITGLYNNYGYIESPKITISSPNCPIASARLPLVGGYRSKGAVLWSIGLDTTTGTTEKAIIYGWSSANITKTSCERFNHILGHTGSIPEVNSTLPTQYSNGTAYSISEAQTSTLMPALGQLESVCLMNSGAYQVVSVLYRG